MNPPVLPRILVIEDEPDLREATVSYLATEHMQVHGVETLRQANEWCRDHEFDILVLDLGLPDGDGLSWLQQALSVKKSKGVIIMTARGQSEHRLQGLRAGADAYLVKPVPMEELALHISNLFGRLQTLPTETRAPAPAARTPEALWQLNAKTWHLIAPNGKRLLLRHSEKTLLQALLSPAGDMLSKDQIIQSQTTNPMSYDYRRIETLVRRLRERCKESLDLHLPIQTIYGKGLAFTEPGKVTPLAP